MRRSSEKASKQPEGDQKKETPSITLPKGFGTIHCIGGKFTANQVTGTGSMTVPIANSVAGAMYMTVSN